jgi:hypothetical protein
LRYRETLPVSQADDPAALNNRGLAHRGPDQHEAAAEAFQRATQLQWDHAPAWANLATTLITLGRLEQALSAGTTALRVAPLNTKVERLADVTNEIGRTLLALGRPEEALATCRDFLKRHPSQPTVVWNMSLCLLLLGQFEEGWRADEHRFDVPGHDRRPDGAIVLDPSQVAGKRVLILTEQGRGDMLQCIRYAPLLAGAGCNGHRAGLCRPRAVTGGDAGCHRRRRCGRPTPEGRSGDLRHESAAGIQISSSEHPVPAHTCGSGHGQPRTQHKAANRRRLVRIAAQPRTLGDTGGNPGPVAGVARIRVFIACTKTSRKAIGPGWNPPVYPSTCTCGNCAISPIPRHCPFK